MTTTTPHDASRLVLSYAAAHGYTGHAAIAVTVRAFIDLGMDPRDAIDAVLGPGTARALIDDLYATLRQRAGVSTTEA